MSNTTNTEPTLQNILLETKTNNASVEALATQLNAHSTAAVAQGERIADLLYLQNATPDERLSYSLTRLKGKLIHAIWKEQFSKMRKIWHSEDKLKGARNLIEKVMEIEKVEAEIVKEKMKEIESPLQFTSSFECMVVAIKWMFLFTFPFFLASILFFLFGHFVIESILSASAREAIGNWFSFSWDFWIAMLLTGILFLLLIFKNFQQLCTEFRENFNSLRCEESIVYRRIRCFVMTLGLCTFISFFLAYIIGLIVAWIYKGFPLSVSSIEDAMHEKWLLISCGALGLIFLCIFCLLFLRESILRKSSFSYFEIDELFDKKRKLKKAFEKEFGMNYINVSCLHYSDSTLREGLTLLFDDTKKKPLSEEELRNMVPMLFNDWNKSFPNALRVSPTNEDANRNTVLKEEVSEMCQKIYSTISKKMHNGTDEYFLSLMRNDYAFLASLQEDREEDGFLHFAKFIPELENL